MADSCSALLLFLLIIAVATTNATNSITIHQELETTLRTLGIHGYTLFANAITTSDIQYQLLTTAAASSFDASTSQFTMFAPKDGPIFDLDMTSDAADYVRTLRRHVIPNRRLTFADLQNLTSPFLDTLLPYYSVLIGKTLDAAVSINGTGTTAGVMVDGSRVSDPDLFLGSSIAVHGIDGILSTGLDIRHQHFSDSDNGSGSGPHSPTESPSPLSGNIPADLGLAPAVASAPQINWNIPADVGLAPAGVPVVASAPQIAGNIPVKDQWQMSPVGAEGVKKKPRRKNRGHHRHRQQRNREL